MWGGNPDLVNQTRFSDLVRLIINQLLGVLSNVNKRCRLSEPEKREWNEEVRAFFSRLGRPSAGAGERSAASGGRSAQSAFSC